VRNSLECNTFPLQCFGTVGKTTGKGIRPVKLVSSLVFYGTFSTNRLPHAIEVGHVSHRVGSSLRPGLYGYDPLATVRLPQRCVFLANHLASNDNLTRTTKRQNTYQLKLIYKNGP